MPQCQTTAVAREFRSQNAKTKKVAFVTKSICSGCLQTAIVTPNKAHHSCRGIFGGFKLRPSLQLSFPKRAGTWTDVTSLLGEALVNRDKVIVEATIEQAKTTKWSEIRDQMTQDERAQIDENVQKELAA